MQRSPLALMGLAFALTLGLALAWYSLRPDPAPPNRPPGPVDPTLASPAPDAAPAPDDAPRGTQARPPAPGPPPPQRGEPDSGEPAAMPAADAGPPVEGDAATDAGAVARDGSPGGPQGDAAGSTEAGAQGEEPSGQSPREKIQGAIQGMKPHVKDCYEKLLEEFPEADGRIVMTFTIVGDGDTSHIDLEGVSQDSSLYDKSLHQCMLDALRGVEMPAWPQGQEVKVTYPFQLSTGEDAPEAP